MATGFCVSYADLAFALFFILSRRVNKFEDLLQRESQLLHKYDEQAAHPESFQRISNLSGIGTQDAAECDLTHYMKAVLSM
ncbi:hypothetical protein L1887_44035 [Cichorium endivia]|nr:hypothetical protein L1887_44035 [Cichorium endivia]